jgi:hypothetical protein
VRRPRFQVRPQIFCAFLLVVALSRPRAIAQAASETTDKALAQSVQELRQQVEELRAAVADMKAEASEYRAQSEELRKQLQSLRSSPPAQPSSVVAAEQPGNNSTDQRLTSVEETTQLLQNQLRSQYQTKVESASKYRARLSGLVLLNLFSNHGTVDNIDVPSYADPTNSYGTRSSFGATLRQSELGLEVFGPEVHGARTSGQVQLDFGGGFPSGALDGINTGLVRLRTASVRLDWPSLSVVAGQDNLFISPNAPTSFASLIIPGFGYSGNLWAWAPQLRVEKRFSLSGTQNLVVQGSILDNVTSQPSYGTLRHPQAGESSGQPAYAVRTGWTANKGDRPASFGVSGYYSRQNWGWDWNVDGWAIASDWRLPLPAKFELSGELYRGRAVGGLGGGIGQSVLFSGNPADPNSDFRALNSAGGWSQIKFSPTQRLEFNGAFGMDNPFASDITAYPNPVGVYQSVLTANRSETLNFIFRPRSDLLFSAEYRHLRTSQLASFSTADQINVMMGVLF